MHKKNYIIVSAITCALFFGYGYACAQSAYSEAFPEANYENSPKKINKLDNFIRKMYLVANDVLTSENYEDDSNILPTDGIYIKTDAKTTGVAAVEGLVGDIVNNEPDEEVVLPPIVPNTVPVTVGGKKDGGLIGKYFENVKDNGAVVDNIPIIDTDYDDGIYKDNPEYLKKIREEYNKKREEEEKKKLEEPEKEKEKDVDDESIVINADDGRKLIVKKRPEENYRNERLPSAISKKQYTRENEHLPQVVYEDEYKKILFDSVLTENLDVMRAMVDRLGTTEVRNANGNTPLLYAVMAGKYIPAKVLVGMGAGIDITNNEGVSPLYVAIKEKRKDLVDLLVRKGGNAKILNKNGKTLLMLAAEDNNIEMTNMLLTRELAVDAVMDDGNTALHFAAKHNSYSVAKALLNKGANIDKINFEGYTPLMIAAAYGAEDVVDLLINEGADVAITDALGQDALALANINSQHGIIAMLVSAKSRLQEKPQHKQDYSPIDEDLAKIPMPVKKPLLPPAPAFSSSEKAKMLEPMVKKPAAVPTPVFTEEEKAKM